MPIDAINAYVDELYQEWLANHNYGGWSYVR